MPPLPDRPPTTADALLHAIAVLYGELSEVEKHRRRTPAYADLVDTIRAYADQYQAITRARKDRAVASVTCRRG